MRTQQYSKATLAEWNSGRNFNPTRAPVAPPHRGAPTPLPFTTPRTPSEVTAKRRRLLDEARKRFPNNAMEWRNGVLVFSSSDKEVPGVEHVPKVK